MNQFGTKLITSSQILHGTLPWHQTVLKEIEARLAGDSGFPCVFANNAFRKQLLRFIFVENIEHSSIQHLSIALKDYVELSRNWDGSLNTAYPLVIAFSNVAVHASSIDDYHSFGWYILQKLHELDPAPWPENVSQDPNSVNWSMCFNGMPLFFNMSNPAHQIRKSRNLGGHFLFVVNPRDRFDVFAGDSNSGRKARANIRNRIAQFDGTPHALQLGTYGSDSREWCQYGLIEENKERTDLCPFLQSISAA